MVTSVGSGPRLVRAEVDGRKAPVRRSLVPVGGEARVPAEVVPPPVLGRADRTAQPQVGPFEDPVVRVREELRQRLRRLGIRERERRRQVVDEPTPKLLSLKRREEDPHQRPSALSDSQPPLELGVCRSHIGLPVQSCERKLVRVLDTRSRGGLPSLPLRDSIPLGAPNGKHGVGDKPTVGVIGVVVVVIAV